MIGTLEHSGGAVWLAVANTGELIVLRVDVDGAGGRGAFSVGVLDRLRGGDHLHDFAALFGLGVEDLARDGG